jgi:DNA-binding NtrC family response regulator
MTVVPCTGPAGEQDFGACREGVILRVDDEDYVRDLIGRILQQHGFSTVPARNGEEALSQIARHGIRLVICNIWMPPMSGPQLFDCVTHISVRLGQRFIFCSGDTASEASCSFLRSSGQPYLTKPFDLDELMCLVTRFALEPVVLQQDQVEQVRTTLGRLRGWGRAVRPLVAPSI